MIRSNHPDRTGSTIGTEILLVVHGIVTRISRRSLPILVLHDCDYDDDNDDDDERITR